MRARLAPPPAAAADERDRFICFYPFIPFFTLYCNLIATVETDVAGARRDLALTQWMQATMEAWSRDRPGLERFAAVIRRLNTVAEYFVAVQEGSVARAVAERGSEIGSVIGALAGAEFEFSVNEFLLSPVEYARVMETVVVRGDAHTDWWSHDFVNLEMEK